MNSGPNASSTGERDARKRDQEHRVDAQQAHQAPDHGARHVESRSPPINRSHLVPEVAGNGAAALPDGIDRSDGIAGADHRRRELRRRVVKSVDDHGVVEPEVQTHARGSAASMRMRFSPAMNGLVDLAR